MWSGLAPEALALKGWVDSSAIERSQVQEFLRAPWNLLAVLAVGQAAFDLVESGLRHGAQGPAHHAVVDEAVTGEVHHQKPMGLVQVFGSSLAQFGSWRLMVWMHGPKVHDPGTGLARGHLLIILEPSELAEIFEDGGMNGFPPGAGLLSWAQGLRPFQRLTAFHRGIRS